ncbi:MAG TPA: hypothetical protein VJ323_12550, partial [Bryobacteraceae bacterium]|nr:hypothetical protein [Bryobacteraceae bacterium]
GDALSHENLGRMRIADRTKISRARRPSFLKLIRPPRITPGDPRRHPASAHRIRSARICMAAMSGTIRDSALHLTITWTQLPATADDFIWQ